MFITNKRFKKLEEFTLTKISECDTHIAKQEIINKQILKTLEAFDKNIEELERIVKNQPLIKKYQKTLDILLKNIQD